MSDYIKIPLPEPIRVNSLISAYHRQVIRHFDKGLVFGFTELFYVESGSFSFSANGEIITLNPGQLLLFPPGTFSASACHNTATFSIITFLSDSAALEPLYNRIITLSSQQHEMLNSVINKALDILVWSRSFNNSGFSIKEGTDELTVQEVKNSLELLLINLCKSIKSPSSYNEKLFYNLTAYLKEHVCEKLTLNDIANAFSINVSRLKRICATQCNTSPIEYFISLKLVEAKRMIEETDLNISQIADSLGFSSIHYFSKLFKSKNGISPSQYAKLIKNRN